MQIFDVIIFFELRTIQQKTVKPTYLCPLGARKLAEGKGHETLRKKQPTNAVRNQSSATFCYRTGSGKVPTPSTTSVFGRELVEFTSVVLRENSRNENR